MTTHLEVRSLTKDFASRGGSITALENVNLHVEHASGGYAPGHH